MLLRHLDGVPAVNLRRLYYFAVLAEELNYRRAAERLYVAEPALSEQIRSLEREFEVKLFERGRSGTRLTPAGELLQQEAYLLLRHAQGIIERVRTRANSDMSQLRIAYTRSADYLGTTELVRDFRHDHPEIEIHTTVAWTSFNIASLRAYVVDVAFVRPPLNEPDIEVVDLVDEELVVALPPGHRLIMQPEVSPADLHDEDVVIWPRDLGAGYYDRVITQIWGMDKPKIVLEEPDDEQILAAVSGGAGIAVVGLHRGTKLQPQNVTLRRFTRPAPTIKLGVAWLRDSSTLAIETFVATCRQALRV
jgi:DNA-binding transcriptional LysR family regulator